MAGKKSKKDTPSNKIYKNAMGWIKNKERRQAQHQTRLKRKDAHMARRAKAGKTTPADIRWRNKQKAA